ncbi:MAG TPA: GAF and ANTAR domain-containing protein [Jatrophihabitans sp.]|jgi:GAF domain-containing protein|uniref:GAF and ANTAR domain-containing protein n=1 Tax=Jatrophihabitans sp. TaxID=1932789 RepID=UPI002F080E0B
MTTDQPQLLSPHALAASFAELARELAGHHSENDTWTAIVKAALRTVPGAEDADITILRGGKFSTVAPSSDFLRQVDAIQYELTSGPCVDAILQQCVFRTGDLSCDPRWPEFGHRAAHEQGVFSMLGFRMYLENNDTIGGLNLYSTQRDAFDSTAELTGGIIATHAAIAMSGAQHRNQAEHLRLALESNRQIGVAMGVLMSRQHVTKQQAFDLLRIASQHTHRKLADIAMDVSETGILEFPQPVQATSA